MLIWRFKNIYFIKNYLKKNLKKEKILKFDFSVFISNLFLKIEKQKKRKRQKKQKNKKKEKN
jgi:predicted metal-dependent RNase